MLTPFRADYISGMASATTSTSRPSPSQINADLQDLADPVHREFDDRLDPRAIDECLAKVAARFADARSAPSSAAGSVRDQLQARL